MPFIPMEDRALSRAGRSTLMTLLRGVGRMEDDFDPQEDVIDVYVQRLHAVPRLQRAWSNLNALQKDTVVFLMSRPQPVGETDFQAWAKASHNIRGAELNKLISQLSQRAWLWTTAHGEDKAYWVPTPIRAWWASTSLASRWPLEGGEHLSGTLFTDSLILWTTLEQNGCRGTQERKGIRWYKKDLEILASRLYPGVRTQTAWLVRQRVQVVLDTFVEAGWWQLDEKGLVPAQELDIPMLASNLGEAILQTLLASRLKGVEGGIFWCIQNMEGEIELKKVLAKLEKDYHWPVGGLQETMELFGAIGAALGWKIGDLSFETMETGGERNLLRWLSPNTLSETRAPGVVQPNFEVLISSKAPARQLHLLLSLCTLKANDNYFTLHLDREYLARTMAMGFNFKKVLTLLEGVGQREIPQNVAFTLRDWAKSTVVMDETNLNVYLPPFPELGLGKDMNKEVPWLKALSKIITVPKKGGLVKLDEKTWQQAVKVFRERHVTMVDMPYPVPQKLPKMQALTSPWRLAEDAPEDPHHARLKDFLKRHRAEVATGA